MEAFKQLERESKTKAFSKAGLARGTAETPEEVRAAAACLSSSAPCTTLILICLEGTPRRVRVAAR